MVDTWGTHSDDYDDPLNSRNRAEWELAEEKVRTRFDKTECAEIYKANSLDQVNSYPDGYFDFVYIDADHTSPGVDKDIEAWLPKVKPTGVFGGHDYCPRFSDVITAVNKKFATDYVIHIADKPSRYSSWFVLANGETLPGWDALIEST